MTNDKTNQVYGDFSSDSITLECVNPECPEARFEENTGGQTHGRQWACEIYYPDGNPDGSSSWDTTKNHADLCPACGQGGVGV